MVTDSTMTIWTVRRTQQGEQKMNKMMRVMAPAVLTVLLAACASAPVEEPTTEPTNTAPTTRPEPQPVMNQVDPTDYTNPINLTEEDSILSRRVIYFDYDQSTIRREFAEVVRAHGVFLAANPGYRATLEGHADERGTREYNLGLGERRGNGVSSRLTALGSSGSQIRVVSYGEERPVATCSNESCWSQNRRVEISYTKVN